MAENVLTGCLFCQNHNFWSQLYLPFFCSPAGQKKEASVTTTTHHFLFLIFSLLFFSEDKSRDGQSKRRETGMSSGGRRWCAAENGRVWNGGEPGLLYAQKKNKKSVGTTGWDVLKVQMLTVWRDGQKGLGSCLTSQSFSSFFSWAFCTCFCSITASIHIMCYIILQELLLVWLGYLIFCLVLWDHFYLATWWCQCPYWSHWSVASFSNFLCLATRIESWASVYCHGYPFNLVLSKNSPMMTAEELSLFDLLSHCFQQATQSPTLTLPLIPSVTCSLLEMLPSYVTYDHSLDFNFHLPNVPFPFVPLSPSLSLILRAAVLATFSYMFMILSC